MKNVETNLSKNNLEKWIINNDNTEDQFHDYSKLNFPNM